MREEKRREEKRKGHNVFAGRRGHKLSVNGRIILN
jgi:hypothetical protein